MKKVFGVLAVLAIFCFIITPALACDGDDCGQQQDPVCENCDDLWTGGSVDVQTDQYMETVTDTVDCNEVVTTDLGTQDIWGSGIGDSEISVSGSAYLGQEAPYETTITVPNGEITHSGDSVMEVSVQAGTDAFCQEFEISAHTERSSQTDNVIGDDWMWSGLNSSACAAISATGAEGTLGFGVNIQAVDAYEASTDDGRLQVGITSVSITGGTIDP